MHHAEPVVLLFVLVAGLVILANKLAVPYPVLLVLGGLALSFVGVALAIGVPQANVDARVLLGDLMVVGGGALWAATTLIVKATPLLRVPGTPGSCWSSTCRSSWSPRSAPRC